MFGEIKKIFESTKANKLMNEKYNEIVNFLDQNLFVAIIFLVCNVKAINNLFTRR